jgi:hypothetical protein
MGVIICGIILVVLYFAKLLFPEFVVGVAQIDAVVNFGRYVETHLWAYYVFVFLTSMFVYYFYCCACCRVRKLTKLQFLIVSISVILLLLLERSVPQYYSHFNNLSLIVLPIIICYMNKETNINRLYSLGAVYTIHTFAQILSAEIRDIATYITKPNIATFTILLIDAYIWLVLLYNHNNYKEV